MEPSRNESSEMLKQKDPATVRECLHRLLRLLAKSVARQLQSEPAQEAAADKRPS